ncbi:MAG: LOG family protein [Candidatus Spechtbacteria bacterium]|nr:LOG family protein [Candidatus Spechtbacteria bacterium]
MGYANFGKDYDFREKVRELLRGREGAGPIRGDASNGANRKLQIGVMGSAADLAYSDNIAKLAEQIGKYVALAGAVLMFGAEKDYDSLSTAACRGAKKVGGLTIGVTYGKGLDDVYEKENADIIIASGMERGGGRELALVLSCDAIICISGGSGTLTEIAIAYQANIPIVVLRDTGGWSEKLADQYLDARKRVQIEAVKTAKEAVLKAIELNCWKWLTGGLEH